MTLREVAMVVVEATVFVGCLGALSFYLWMLS